jgi:hypothetical protein
MAKPWALMKAMKSVVVAAWLAVACQARPSHLVEAPREPAPRRLASAAAATGPAPGAAAEPRAALLVNLKPRAGDYTLHLGLHVEQREGYGSLFGSGGPLSVPGPGYRTFVLSFGAAAVSLQRELPYLAVPQANGFLYVGEASAHEDRSGHESEAEQERIQSGQEAPKWYVNTLIWQTRDEQRIVGLIKKLERQLQGAAWGSMNSESVEYVTPRALMLSHDTAEWTGGATAFQGTNTIQMQSLSGALQTTVLARHGRQAVERLAQAIVAKYQLEPEHFEGVDKPLWLPWGPAPVLTTDAHACLTRFEGRVWEAGCVVLPGNSARSFTELFPIREALPDLAPSNFAPLSFSEAKAAWPDMLDIVVAPNEAFVLVLRARGLSVIEVATGRTALELPAARGSVVMAEWVSASGSPQ